MENIRKSQLATILYLGVESFFDANFALYSRLSTFNLSHDSFNILKFVASFPEHSRILDYLRWCLSFHLNNKVSLLLVVQLRMIPAELDWFEALSASASQQFTLWFIFRRYHHQTHTSSLKTYETLKDGQRCWVHGK